jgi:hypothetical protein
MYKAVRDSWQGNLDYWNAAPLDFMTEISLFIRTHKVERFRWHVAGDIPSKAYFDGMRMVANANPGTQFLAFTKQYQFITTGTIPQNLRFVVSMWPGYIKALGATTPGAMTAVYNTLTDRAAIAWMRPAEPSDDVWYNEMINTTVKLESLDCSGKCDECFMCWHMDRGTSVVFDQH